MYSVSRELKGGKSRNLSSEAPGLIIPADAQARSCSKSPRKFDRWYVMCLTNRRDDFRYAAIDTDFDSKPTPGPRRSSAGKRPMKKPNSPMQLTRAADYAIRVMIHLSTPAGNSRVSLPELAQASGAPESFLSKVMQALTHAGMISSRRGQAGGFLISSKGRAASLREVIEAIDGPIYLNVCLMSGNSCRRKTTCPAHPIWQQAQKAMLDVLSSATVAGLAGGDGSTVQQCCPATYSPALAQRDRH
jgi:Rrf2 family protein